MKITALELPEVRMIEPRLLQDARGSFAEVYQQERYEAAGIAGPFVQDNVSWSRRGVLRGLHFQHPHGQAKLATVLAGEVFDVAVDVRAGSPMFGRWCGVRLSTANGRQLYVPAGFAHGFVVLSESATFLYKCSDSYHPEAERVVAWNDPAIGVSWPTTGVTLSPRDAAAPRLAEISADLLPSYDG